MRNSPTVQPNAAIGLLGLPMPPGTLLGIALSCKSVCRQTHWWHQLGLFSDGKAWEIPPSSNILFPDLVYGQMRCYPFISPKCGPAHFYWFTGFRPYILSVMYNTGKAPIYLIKHHHTERRPRWRWVSSELEVLLQQEDKIRPHSKLLTKEKRKEKKKGKKSSGTHSSFIKLESNFLPLLWPPYSQHTRSTLGCWQYLTKLVLPPGLNSCFEHTQAEVPLITDAEIAVCFRWDCSDFN